MRRICPFALLALMTAMVTVGAQAQTTPEQTAHRRHYGTIPSPTRHLGEIRPRLDRLGTLRGPQGSLIQSSPMPYIGSGFVMQVTKQPPDSAQTAAQAQDATRGSAQDPSKQPDYPPIDKPNGIANRIMTCWLPPTSAAEMEVTVRVSFSRSGEVVGQPRITYVKAGSDDNLRKLISSSILKAIQACVPLRFTPGLGQAIAGRSFAIRFIVPAVRKPAKSI